MTLFNRLYNSPFLASNEYHDQRNPYICGTDAFTQKLNTFSTAQDSATAER